MTHIIRVQHSPERPYVVVSRATAQNDDLSYEARGMLLYLLSKPDNWEVNVDDLQRDGCKRDRVYKIINELVAARYMTPRTKYQDKAGKWQWTPYRVFEEPYTEIPDTVEPYTLSPDTVNTEIKQSKERQSKEKEEEVIDSTESEPESTGQPEKTSSSAADDKSRIFKAYEANIGLLSMHIRDAVVSELDDGIPADWIVEAIEQSAEYNKRSWAYARTIFRRWQTEGRTTAKATPQAEPPRHAAHKPFQFDEPASEADDATAAAMLEQVRKARRNGKK